MVTAVIMAGGKGTRMKSVQEKPLLKIKGKPMIQWVYEAVLRAREVDELVVATSKHTPHSTMFIRKLGLNLIVTPGGGYVEDLGFIINEFSWNNSSSEEIDEVIITISADLPLLTGEILDDVILEYKNCGKPAMCVAVPVDFFEEINLKPHMVMGDMVPSGLNILRRNNNQQDEEVLRLRKIELALNINSPEDLIFLEKYFEFKSFKNDLRN